MTAVVVVPLATTFWTVPVGGAGTSQNALAATTAPGTTTATATNLVTNPDFEQDTTGWTRSGAVLERSTPGHTGSHAARLRNVSSSARTAVLNDAVNTVSSTVAGRSTTASAWVRTTKPGTTVALRVMEYKGSTLLGQRQSSVWLPSTGWQRVSVTYAPTSSGATLDLNVLAWQLPVRSSVMIDDVTMAVTPSPLPSGWRVAWADEFDGAVVDRAKWNVRDQTSNSNEQSYLLARNVTQGGGSLTIRAQREVAGGRQYTSGYLDTIGKTAIGIGSRWEIRAKVPTQLGSSQGLWPAFWLRSNETAGEIDVAEWYGSPNPNLADAHRKVDNVVHESTMGGMAKSGRSYSFPGASVPSDGFHTYAVELQEDGIHFFVDGVPSHTVSRASSPWIAPMMSGTWNIRMNFQVGKEGTWATAPTAATRLPADFVVDHVRVYRR